MMPGAKEDPRGHLPRVIHAFMRTSKPPSEIAIRVKCRIEISDSHNTVMRPEV